MGYLSVHFPSCLTTQNRRMLHALACVTGLECEASGPKGMRNISFGYDVDCQAPAELNLDDKESMSAADIVAILNANFGMNLTEEDIT